MSSMIKWGRQSYLFRHLVIYNKDKYYIYKVIYVYKIYLKNPLDNGDGW